MSRDLVIGIDCSTTATKAVVWDMSGTAVAEGWSSINLSSPHQGWGEQDPIDWWRATVNAIASACREIEAGRVAALAVTHQRETFVCLDAAGEALRPAMLWLDTRATEEVAAYGNDRVHEVTGKPPNTATSWYKLLWLKEHEPQVLAHTHRVADVQTYIVHRMTGRWRTSYGSVDPLGLLDLRTGELDGPLLEQVGLEADQIADIYAPGQIIGELQADVAAITGLTEGLPVVAGIGDGQAAGLGAGITTPGDAYLNLGTGMVSGTVSSEYRWSHEFRMMSSAVPGTYTPETFIGGGTYNINWFVEQFSDIGKRPFSLDLSAERILEAAAAELPAGSEGLVALPYLSGALTPYWDSNARGVFFGLSERHGKAHMYRALLEGLTMEQRLSSIGAQEVLGTSFKRFLLMGGGSKSHLWCQIIADILQRPAEVSRETQTTCLGAGILSAAGVGLHPSIADTASAMSGTARVFRPEEPARTAYDRLYEIYRQLYPRLQSVFKDLKAFTNENR